MRDFVTAFLVGCVIGLPAGYFVSWARSRMRQQKRGDDSWPTL